MNTLVNNVIKQTSGQFITVTFTKKDGSTRTINGRTGVRYNGKASPIRRYISGKSYLLIWSVSDRGYRMVNQDTISKVSAGHTVLYVK
jgi:hypothetical protein